MTDDMLKVSDAARLARVTPATIYYWLKTKRLTSEQSGPTKLALIKRSDLLAVLPELMIKTINKENGTDLKSVPQIAQFLKVQYQTARNIIFNTGVHRYKLFNQSREIYIDLKELLEKMREYSAYQHYVPTDVQIRRWACGCNFCLIDN